MHGGDIYTHGIFKGIELLDFSSNINPLGIPEKFKESIIKNLDTVKVYPDAKYRLAKDNILEYLNTKSLKRDNLILGNGAAEIIDLVISCFNNICIVVPSFIEYEISAKKWNCNISYSYLYIDQNFKIDYTDILKKLENSQAIIIGNPNNPNGGTLDKEKFKKILNYCEENEKTIIIDEAFIEFTGNSNDSFIKECLEYNCLFLIRALTKFFAVPGIRFGYGISKNKTLIHKINSKQLPWNINCFAEIAANYVFKDTEYIKKSIDFITKERNYMLTELKNINIFSQVLSTNSNFVLCKLKENLNYSFYDTLLKNKVLARNCKDFKGLSDKYVRFAIKDRDKNSRLIRILKSIKMKTN